MEAPYLWTLLTVLIGLQEKLFLGPIFTQQAFLTLITISSKSSSRSQIFSNFSSIQTDGAINEISSAYKTFYINVLVADQPGKLFTILYLSLYFMKNVPIAFLDYSANKRTGKGEIYTSLFTV